jgi:hypothetical protein
MVATKSLNTSHPKRKNMSACKYTFKNFKHRPVVYISGPITGSGNLHSNIKNGVYKWADLIDIGFAPICPHMNDFGFYLARPFDWHTIIEVDLSILNISDAVLRLPGKSAGADLEVQRAKELGIPVFYQIVDLTEFFKRS